VNGIVLDFAPGYTPNMKLRVRGNSLRFRLTQKEVDRLIAEGTVGECVRFSPSDTDRLRYTLEASETALTVSAKFGRGEVLVTVPAWRAAEWAKTDAVGITSTQAIGDGADLHIAVEKDFRCLQPRTDEDESDNFPNSEQSPHCAPS